MQEEHHKNVSYTEQFHRIFAQLEACLFLHLYPKVSHTSFHLPRQGRTENQAFRF